MWGLFGWPYAAKVALQHEYVGNYVYFYCIFAHPMNQLVKPLTAKFSGWMGDYSYPTTAVTWIDAFTLQVKSNMMTAPSGRMRLTFLGPDPLLKTTWGKQWEPWAYQVSTKIG